MKVNVEQPPPAAHVDALLSTSDLFDVDHHDPTQEMLDRAGMPQEDVAQITRLMQALGELRTTEQDMATASRRYMRLNDTDMRALRYLIVCSNRGLAATATDLAKHLGISSASTTKMLDRLEQSEHITRAPHPTDRRALAISITPDTRRSAMDTVGRQHAKRFHAAARLSPAEREVVIRFLADMTGELQVGDDEWVAHDAAG